MKTIYKRRIRKILHRGAALLIYVTGYCYTPQAAAQSGDSITAYLYPLNYPRKHMRYVGLYFTITESKVQFKFEDSSGTTILMVSDSLSAKFDSLIIAKQFLLNFFGAIRDNRWIDSFFVGKVDKIRCYSVH